MFGWLVPLIAKATDAPQVAVADSTDWIRDLAYLVASALFIFGIKGMTHPRTAVRGNLIGACGMLLAVLVTLVFGNVVSWGWIIAGLIIGGATGVFLATRVAMTQMPQLVALFNGLGGGASVLVAGAALMGDKSLLLSPIIAAGASGLIGAVTLTGSLVAAAKLEEMPAFRKALSLPFHQVASGGLFLLCILFMFWMTGGSAWPFLPLVLFALVLGVMLVVPIGGADMPVVIALLNSYSGLAAAATGFVIDNTVLIIAGSLVGASGIILTNIMCKAMNRSITNVLFGVMEASGAVADADEVYAGKIKSTSPEEVAMLLDGVQRVVFVPGYGLAVAQAQHAVHDLATLLEKKGVTVEYAIHPVAGRMPGHMNVLLAEADVPYDQLKEMDEINPTMSQCDVAIVIGANDVVNPVARTDPKSPIAGMPIINVDQARTVVVIKRSLSPGFAGIPNPLFAADNTLMLFGDGKQMMLELITAVKEG